MNEHKPLSTLDFAQALHKAGIIGDPGKISRIVIDADARQKTVKMYVEHHADTRWLDVIPSVTSVEVVTSERRMHWTEETTEEERIVDELFGAEKPTKPFQSPQAHWKPVIPGPSPQKNPGE